MGRKYLVMSIDDGTVQDEVERLFKMLSEHDDIVFVSNTEFYELFKDKIPSEPTI